MSLGRCKRRGCWSPLVDRMDSLGRLVVGCESCARNKDGLCRECPKPLERKRAIRCDACALRVDRALDNALHKKRYRKDKGYRQQQLDQHRRRRQEPGMLEREADRQRARRAKNGPRVRTELDRVFEKMRRAARPLSREAKDRHNANRRRRWANDAEYRERKKAICAMHRERRRARKLNAVVGNISPTRIAQDDSRRTA